MLICVASLPDPLTYSSLSSYSSSGSAHSSRITYGNSSSLVWCFLVCKLDIIYLTTSITAGITISVEVRLVHFFPHSLY